MHLPAPPQHAHRGPTEPPEPRTFTVRGPFPRNRSRLLTIFATLTALIASLFAGLGTMPSATAAPTTYSIWASTVKPSNPAEDDSRSVQLGVKFRTAADGWITAIRYFKSAENTGPHTGRLWSANGTRLADVAFSNETTSGWQQAVLSTPVKVQSGSTYTASYRAPQGRYANDTNKLSGQRTTTTNALTALAGVYNYGDGLPTQTWQESNYFVDVVFTTQAPSSTPKPSTTTATPKPSTTTATPSPSTTPTSTPTSTGTTPGAWPNAANTGWNGTLGAYTGPCTILTSGYVIDSKDVRAKCGELLIQTTNVVIKNSRLPRVESTYRDGATSVSIADSTVEAGNWVDGAVWGYNINLTRSEVTGAQHSVHANNNVTVTDSWLHSQYNPDGQGYHNNAFISNGGSNMVLRHNTLHCTAILNKTDGGCTADVSLFGDFGPITNVLVENNLLKANNSSISYCAYGGYSPSKPYAVATSIRYVNNVFERGANGKCGVYGPVTSFQSTASGNVWSGNKFDDGTLINP